VRFQDGERQASALSSKSTMRTPGPQRRRLIPNETRPGASPGRPPGTDRIGSPSSRSRCSFHEHAPALAACAALRGSAPAAPWPTCDTPRIGTCGPDTSLPNRGGPLPAGVDSTHLEASAGRCGARARDNTSPRRNGIRRTGSRMCSRARCRGRSAVRSERLC
jgi:hypothetical protein